MANRVTVCISKSLLTGGEGWYENHRKKEVAIGEFAESGGRLTIKACPLN